MSTWLPQFHSPTHWQTSIPSTVPWEAPIPSVERKDWLNKKQTDMATMASTKMEHFAKDRRANEANGGRYGVGPQSQGDGEKKAIYWTKERFAPREDLRNASRSEKKGRRTRRSLGRWGGIGTKSTEQYLLNRSHYCKGEQAAKIPPPLFATTAKRIFMGWNVRISMFVDLEELKNE